MGTTRKTTAGEDAVATPADAQATGAAEPTGDGLPAGTATQVPGSRVEDPATTPTKTVVRGDVLGRVGRIGHVLYEDGVGFRVGARAPHAVYQGLDGKFSDEPVTGRVIVAEGDLVTRQVLTDLDGYGGVEQPQDASTPES
jgi:hypothetical protein